MALFKRKPKDTAEMQKKEEKTVEERVEVSAGAVVLPKGGDVDSYRIVLSPHVTEKATLMGEQNKYVFKVAENANKTAIKKAVASLYKVEVAKVRIAYAQSKLRRVGKNEGRKSGFKKAIVTLKEGSKIDIAA